MDKTVGVEVWLNVIHSQGNDRVIHVCMRLNMAIVSFLYRRRETLRINWIFDPWPLRQEYPRLSFKYSV